MSDGITDIEGISVGHAWHASAATGCTVVLCPDGAIVGVDVRGSAPATRETDLCRPGTLVERAHAVFLTGGSAFGLDACAGVMRYLHERSIGFETGVVPVPIVPGAAIFDLRPGAVAWPEPEHAYQACLAATSGEIAQGAIGAGTGATVGKFLGPQRASPGGLGTAAVRAGPALVAALIVVNAVGNVVDPSSGEIIAGARDLQTGRFESFHDDREVPAAIPPLNTTIGVIATNAALDSDQINHLATVAHDGLARTIQPAHTFFDGDAIFGLATCRVPVEWPRDEPALGRATVRAVERAILRAVA